MPKFRNVSGGHLDLPALDVRVDDKETFEVSDEDAAGLLEQPAFQIVKTTKKES